MIFVTIGIFHVTALSFKCIQYNGCHDLLKDLSNIAILNIKSYDDQTKWMSFLIEGDDLLEKYNTIWDKISADVKRNLIASLSTIGNF